MSEEHMNIDGRMKIWGGFIKLVTYSSVVIVIALLLMWWTLI